MVAVTMALAMVTLMTRTRKMGDLRIVWQNFGARPFNRNSSTVTRFHLKTDKKGM